MPLNHATEPKAGKGWGGEGGDSGVIGAEPSRAEGPRNLTLLHNTTKPKAGKGWRGGGVRECKGGGGGAPVDRSPTPLLSPLSPSPTPPPLYTPAPPLSPSILGPTSAPHPTRPPLHPNRPQLVVLELLQ